MSYVTHTPQVSARMHDLLNLFSGLYEWHNFGKGDVLFFRNQAKADEIVSEVSELLGISKQQALQVLLVKTDHKITLGEDGYIFTYDSSKL